MNTTTQPTTSSHNFVSTPGVDARRCLDCNEIFTLADGETAFFALRGLAMPRRCQPCRKARKAAAPRTEPG